LLRELPDVGHQLALIPQRVARGLFGQGGTRLCAKPGQGKRQ